MSSVTMDTTNGAVNNDISLGPEGAPSPTDTEGAANPASTQDSGYSPELDYIQPYAVVKDSNQFATPGEQMTLDGSGSFDVNGEIIGYEWKQVFGTPVEMHGAGSAVCTFEAPAEEGPLFFQLTVTDNEGLQRTIPVIVEVKAAAAETTTEDTQATETEDNTGEVDSHEITDKEPTDTESEPTDTEPEPTETAETDLISKLIDTLKDGWKDFMKMFMALVALLQGKGGDQTDEGGDGNTDTDDQTPIAANQKAVVWGDPHFKDPDDTANADNEKGTSFDFQGEPDRNYQLLKDSGVHFVAHFENRNNNLGNENTVTVIDTTRFGLKDGDDIHEIQFDKDGNAYHVDNEGNRLEIKDGDDPILIGDNKVTYDQGVLTIETAEYTVTQKNVNGTYIRAEIETHDEGVNMDGVMPVGLMGDLFDEDDAVSTGFEASDSHAYDFEELFETIKAEAEAA